MTKARLTGACETSRPFSLTDPRIAKGRVRRRSFPSPSRVRILSAARISLPPSRLASSSLARSPKMDFRNSAAASSFLPPLSHHPLSRFNEAGRKDKRSAVNISGNAKITVFLVYSTASERKVYCLCSATGRVPSRLLGKLPRVPAYLVSNNEFPLRVILGKKRRRDDSHLSFFLPVRAIMSKFQSTGSGGKSSERLQAHRTILRSIFHQTRLLISLGFRN